MDDKQKSAARYIAWVQGNRYVEDIGMFKKLDKHYSTAICTYILSVYAFLPFKTIIIGERPYATKIHPRISSAMSYDASKSGATPSTVGMARDISTNTKLGYRDVEEWFRDSWMYANSGTLVVNCMTFEAFSSSSSLREIIPFQKWLRCILDCSIACGADKIDVVCMGVPATNVTDSVIRSMGKLRSHISKKPYPNPAIVSKGGGGDGSSQISTFGKPGTSIAIAKAIKRSYAYSSLTPRDYISILYIDMSSHLSHVADVIHTSGQLVDAVESAFDDLKTSDKMPRLRECQEQFAAAMLSYRDMVIRDVLEHAVAPKSDSNATKLGKPVEWGSKQGWKKGTESVGTSSKMSAAPEEDAGVAQRFVSDDEDEPPSTPTQETVSDAAQKPVETDAEEPKPVKTKKKMVKRMVKRRVSKPSSVSGSKRDSQNSMAMSTIEESSPNNVETVAGMRVDESQEAALRTIQYYVSDTYAETGEKLMNMIRDTMDSRYVTDALIGTLLDTATRDFDTEGVTPDRTLGMEDGEVSETALLPKVIEKVVAVAAK